MSDPAKDSETDDSSSMARPANVVVLFATALQFLTRIPVGFLINSTEADYRITLRRSVVLFPVVGGLIGLFTASICYLTMQAGFSPWLAAMLALAAEAMLTGAFHEDAFADTCDALGGGWTRERVLEIMKDSRLGTYGTLALILGVGIRAVCTAELLMIDPWLAAVAIIAAASLARLAIVAVMSTTEPIADRNSQARDVSGSQSFRTFLLAAILSLPFWIGWCIAMPTHAAVGLVSVCIAVIWFRRKLLLRIGGTTGDALGCTAYFTQLILIAFATVSR